MNTDLCEWAYLWEINGFLGCVWVWVHICMHFRIKMDISQCYKTHADWCHFFLICLQFLLIFGCCDQCHSVNRSTKKSLGRILICIFLSEVHLRRTAAVRPLSTLRIAKNAQPARFAVTFGLLWGTNAFSCQCHGRGWQRRLCPGRHLLSAGDGTPPPFPPTPLPPIKPDKWFRFVLCSPGKKLSIQSAKWCQGFVSKAYEWQKQPTSFHSPASPS